MKRFGIVSYNMYGNFTNYGSVLQSWALQKVVNRQGKGAWEAIIVDYCPDVLKNANPLNPMPYMWDKDDEAMKMCELSMPAIRKNYEKFIDFYHKYFNITKEKYTANNFNAIVTGEGIDGFICGSDTIFSLNELGFDNGYYANYRCMKNGYTVAYAASFGDTQFTKDNYALLNKRLQNFKALGLRESNMLPYVKENTRVPVEKVLDPTLLLTCSDYDTIAEELLIKDKYICLYSRRYNPEMEAHAETLAKQNGWKIVEISLWATNENKGHIMFYEAGVEEFLSLIKHAEYVVTNSFHGIIFSIQYSRQFSAFFREEGVIKVKELLDVFGLSSRIIGKDGEKELESINYEKVHNCLDEARKKSLSFLNMELEGCE